MPAFVVRVWLPDRPGALGAVASRIGAVRGDLVGIEILERGAGRAIDELVVELPSEGLVPLLTAEMGQVDGVDVEEVRPVGGGARDAQLDALEVAAVLVEQREGGALFAAFGRHALDDFGAEWAMVLERGAEQPVATAGTAPQPAWVRAFLGGTAASTAVTDGHAAPRDVAWAELTPVDAVVVMGRKGRPFRARERRQLAALARIAGSRWAQLSPPPAVPAADHRT